MSVETKTLSKEISEIFWREGFTLATAESCTAGNVAAIITAIPGSSRFYKGGIVAYDNKVKQDLLHVKAETLEQCGCHHLSCQSTFAVPGCICGEVAAGKSLSPYKTITIIIVHDVYSGSGGSYLVGAQTLFGQPVQLIIFIIGPVLGG